MYIICEGKFYSEYLVTDKCFQQLIYGYHWKRALLTVIYFVLLRSPLRKVGRGYSNVPYIDSEVNGWRHRVWNDLYFIEDQAFSLLHDFALLPLYRPQVSLNLPSYRWSSSLTGEGGGVEGGAKSYDGNKYTFILFYSFPPWLKFVPDWPAISVSSWQQSRVRQTIWYGCLLFHS